MRTLNNYINEWKFQVSKTDYNSQRNKSDSKSSERIIVNNKEELKGLIDKRYNINKSELDLSDINVKRIDNFSELFRDFADVETINISGWDLTNASTLRQMFYGCKNLKEIIGIENLNVFYINDMSYMFFSCSSLKNLNLSKWKPYNLTNASRMFMDCNSLETIVGLEQWPTDNLELCESMFCRCKSLQYINLSKWKLTKVQSLMSMFLDCELLETVNLSNIKVTNVSSMTNMFCKCKKLKHVYTKGMKPKKLMYISRMFNGCYNLYDLDINDWSEYFDVNKLSNISDAFKDCMDSVIPQWYKEKQNEENKLIQN